MTEPDAGPNRYGLLASAPAGRAVEVVAGPAGGGVWSDGHTITVGPDVGPSRVVEAVVVQASMIGAGSLSEASMRGVVAQSSVRSRYLGIEGPRAVASMRHLLPRSLSHMISRRDRYVDPVAGTVARAYARTRNPSRKRLHPGRVASPRSARRAQAGIFARTRCRCWRNLRQRR